MRTNLGNQKGVALVLTLVLVFVLMIISSSFILRAVNEWYTAQREHRVAQTSAITEGGVAAAIDQINQLINKDMLNMINVTDPSTVASKAQLYTTNKDGLGFLVKYVAIPVEDNPTQSTRLLTWDGQATSPASFTQGATNFGNGQYSYTILLTEKNDPVKVTTDVWDFSYNYQVQATGQVGQLTSKSTYLGDFTVRVQRDNFARYALFTNHHCILGDNASQGCTAGDATTVWFTKNTSFAGPLHTNDKYSFANTPVFDGTVTQHLTQAQFYNNNHPLTVDADSNPPLDVPVFNNSYTRNIPTIDFSSSVTQASLYSQARGTDNTSGNGIFVAHSGSNVTAGIYVKGTDVSITLGKETSTGNAQYLITETSGSSVTKTITVDRVNNQTKIQQSGQSTITYTGVPDGVGDVGSLIHVDGTISHLQGTVQKDTQLTISSAQGVTITGNLVYENYTHSQGTPGDVGYVPPNADGENNLLGIVAWSGNVLVGSSAPDDVNIHGIIKTMTTGSVVQVDDYDSGDTRGIATLLGGVITDAYGAFGTFSSSTGEMNHGYGRNFVYDERMQNGKSPPYFPTMKTFIAFTNDITDKMVYREGNF